MWHKMADFLLCAILAITTPIYTGSGRGTLFSASIVPLPDFKTVTTKWSLFSYPTTIIILLQWSTFASMSDGGVISF